MRRLGFLAVVGSVCMLPSLFAQGQGDEIKAILTRAIEAHGGEKLMTKFQAGGSKFKGTMKLLNMDVPITGDTSFQKPDKFRNVMTLDIMDKTIEIVQVYDGAKFWVSTMGKTQEIKDEKILKEVRESIRSEGSGNLVDFLKGDYEISSVGEVKVKGRASAQSGQFG